MNFKHSFSILWTLMYMLRSYCAFRVEDEIVISRIEFYCTLYLL